SRPGPSKKSGGTRVLKKYPDEIASGDQDRAAAIASACVDGRLHGGGIESCAVALGAERADVVRAGAQIERGGRVLGLRCEGERERSGGEQVAASHDHTLATF